jgi:hypothetical protein
MKIYAFPEQRQLNPRGFEDFRFYRDFVSTQSRLEVQTDRLNLVNEDYARLYDWIYNEQGRFEGVEANVVDDLGNVYPHFIDLSTLTFTNNDVECDLVARKGMAHFFERANGLTFERMFFEGAIPNTAILDVEYLIVPDDLNLQKAVALTLQISISFQISQAILEVAKLVGDATNPLTATNAVIKAIAIAVQVTVLAVQFAINSVTLKELYLPKVRRFKAMSDYSLIQLGCQYLGYTLDSQILHALRFICTLPKPQMKPNGSIFQFYFNQLSDYYNTGYPTTADSCPTLWSLIESYLTTYNLRCFVYDGRVKIERTTFFQQNANLVIKPTFSDQQTRERVWEYNDEEVYLRKYFRYQSDFTDLQAVNGIPINVRYSERQTIPNTVINADLVNIKGLNEYVVPFDLAAVKTELTGIENAISTLFGIVDSVVNFFGGNGNLQANITDRLGVMLISQQFFSQTKRLWMMPQGLKQVPDYQQKLSMNHIIDVFHPDLKVKNNAKRVEKMTVPFTMQKFKTLEQNNFVTLESGEVAEVANVTYYDRGFKADLVLYFDDTSAFNLDEKKIIQ